MARARLRRIGYPLAAAPTVTDFEALVDAGEIVIDESGRARIVPHPSGRIFRVSAGVRGQPVGRTGLRLGSDSTGSGNSPGISLVATICLCSRSIGGGAVLSASTKPSPLERKGCRTRPTQIGGPGRSVCVHSRRSRLPRRRGSRVRTGHRIRSLSAFMTLRHGRCSMKQSRPARHRQAPSRLSSACRKSIGRNSATTSSKRCTSSDRMLRFSQSSSARLRSGSGLNRSWPRGLGTQAAMRCPTCATLWVVRCATSRT